MRGHPCSTEVGWRLRDKITDKTVKRGDNYGEWGISESNGATAH